jgi:protoheme IX farnesyltransferase
MVKDYLELTKPRITVLILICTSVGYYFARNAGPFDIVTLFHALLGTGLMASGTAALNQWYERDADAKMRRTRKRPMPSGRITSSRGLIFGSVLSVAGLLQLWLGTTAVAAVVSLITEVVYLFLYTPLKRVSPICTTVGAIPGALPPVIGYAAAAGQLTWEALALFAILFVWQFPHFYAIAWMYREDYANAEIRMLPVMEPNGQATARRIAICSMLLIPVSLTPHFLGMVGILYAITATALGLGFSYFGVRVFHDRSVAAARKVLLASVVYLPILLGLMVVDRY